MQLFQFLKAHFLHLHYECCLFVISKYIFLNNSTVRTIESGNASTFLSSIFWNLADPLQILSFLLSLFI